MPLPSLQLFLCSRSSANTLISSQLHKHAVKEAKREKRKEKMPKHIKKKIVSSTSRRKK